MLFDQSKYDFWEYMRRGSIYPLYYDYCIAWTHHTEQIYGYRPTIAIAYFSNDTVFFRVCRNETLKGGDFLLKKLLSNESEIKLFKSLWDDMYKKIISWQKKTNKSKDINYLIHLINEFSLLNIEAQSVWAAKEYIDAYLSEKNYYLEGKSFSFKENKALDDMYRYILKTNVEALLEESSILKLTEKLLNDHPLLKIQMDEYLKKYGWTGATYAEIQYKDYACIVNLLKNRMLYNYSPFSEKTVSHSETRFIYNNLFFNLFEKRKYLMLTSFYLLHNLYEMIGKTFGLYANQAKWITPQEWLMIGNGKRIEQELITERMYCSYVECINGQITWDIGEKSFLREVGFQKGYSQYTMKSVTGTLVFECDVCGECIVLKDKYELPNNKKKYIILTGMTTPDFLPILNRALAIVTDEGGVTCHAASICREMKIPCIVGSKYGTKIFHSGDFLSISGNQVLLKDKIDDITILCDDEIVPVKVKSVVNKQNSQLHCIDLLSIEKKHQLFVGNKAYHLSLLKKKNYNVPDGFVIYGNNFVNTILNELVNEKVINKEQKFAIRSSSIDEDTDSSSQAGYYSTFLNIDYDRISSSVIDCSKKMINENGAASVFIQEMVDSRISGVAFTSHVFIGRLDLLLVEVSKGLGAVVDGTSTPQRYTIKKETNRVERIDFNNTLIPHINNPCFIDKSYSTALLKPDQLQTLADVLISIENVFNYPCDIEWAMDDKNNIYILQSRKIIN